MRKIAIIGLTGESVFMEVDTFPKNGETISVKNIHKEPGGKGFNQALACKKNGLDVYFLTALGNDKYKEECEKILRDNEINYTLAIKDCASAYATIMIDKNGNNFVSVFQGASKYLNLNDLDSFKNVIDNVDIVLLQNEIAYDVLKETIIYAKSKNKYVILNPAPAIYDISELKSYIDLLIPNEIEANAILGKNWTLEDEFGCNAIITLGDKGCIYKSSNIIKKYDAIKTTVVDTTGAGDVFCSAIASKILDNSIDDAINYAIKKSSIHVSKKYVVSAILDK